MASAKARVALSSVGAAVFLTAIKLAVGLATGSLGLLSEAAHSGMDLVAAGMTWWAVRTADRPPDANHPYGHEKIENLAALFETLLLLVTCIWIIAEAVERLFVKRVHVEVTTWSYAVIALSIAVDFTRSRALFKVARRTRSAALEADALHFSTDMLSSIVVLGGLVFTALGYPRGDAVAALGVALFVVWISTRLGRKAVTALSDGVSEEHVGRARRAALSVPKVKRAYDVRVREAGARHFVDMKVVVDASTPLEQAHRLSEAVEKAVGNAFEEADVLVHVEPALESSSGLNETAVRLAREAGATMHALQLRRTKAGLQVDLHLEWNDDLSFARAHELGTRIEEGIRRAFPEVTAVRSHLECSVRGEGMLSEERAVEPEAEAGVRRAVAEVPGVLRYGDLHILEESGRWHVSLICTLPPELKLSGAHEVATSVEQAVRAVSEKIASVTVHTEPGPD